MEDDKKLKVSEQIIRMKRFTYLIAGLVLFLVWLLVWMFSNSFVKVQIDPANSVIKINNSPIDLRNNGSGGGRFKPGEATLTVEADGYVGVSKEIYLKRGLTTKIEMSLIKMPKPFLMDSKNTGETKENDRMVEFISGADENNAIFYLSDSGSALYKAKFEQDSEGKIQTVFNRKISNPALSGITDIIWSPKKDAAIFKKGKKVTYFDFQKYNFVSQEEIGFGDYIGDVAWAPDDSKIAYYFAPPSGERSLIFSDRNNKNKTIVANLKDAGIEDPYLAWSPDSEWLIVIPRNDDINENKIYLFNAYTRQFSTVNEGGGNLKAKFSPDSRSIIYSTYSINPKTPVKSLISIMDLDGNNKRSLDLYADIDKCIWTNTRENVMIVATYDTEKKRESVFNFDVTAKEKSGFDLSLYSESFINEMSTSNDDKLLFYIDKQIFYVVSLEN